MASLEAQTYSDIEYIVIDGASKDATLEVIKQYSTRVTRMVIPPKNQGAHK
ncbi:glycosyltransferase [Aeromonas media]|uniref:glycosyltransferase n=1 Tax=Aeromonas media TaxID=651 RepID=UPI00214B73EF|nr:glycosyltransferase [Aeromonas media]